MAWERNTVQRNAILQAMQEADRPLTLEEVFSAAKQIVSTLGKRTVYRNLDSLREEGRVLAVDYPGYSIAYELNQGVELTHIMCRQCNKLFYSKEAVSEIVYPKSDRFAINGTDQIFFGDCKQGDSCSFRTNSCSRVA